MTDETTPEEQPEKKRSDAFTSEMVDKARGVIILTENGDFMISCPTGFLVPFMLIVHDGVHSTLSGQAVSLSDLDVEKIERHANGEGKE